MVNSFRSDFLVFEFSFLLVMKKNAEEKFPDALWDLITSSLVRREFIKSDEVCVRVSVCVCVWERETDRQTERQRQRQRG